MINLIFRKKTTGVSIEELFTNLKKELSARGYCIKSSEVPCAGVSVNSIIRNLIFTYKQPGLIHITGDIYYVAINPLKKTLLTIHDIGSILKGGKISVLIKKIFWIWLPCLFANKITVISNYSKNELLKIIPWVSNKVRVIYNPVNSQLKKTDKYFNKNYPEILHIGTKSNKNLENTIKGLYQLPCKLVIVGKLTKDQHNLLNKFKIFYENHINIPYSEIKNLYERCDIVSFISKYEGFGLPIIEAQKVGRVVITSTRASIPEIAGEGAHFVNPENIVEIKNGFKKLIEDDSYREKLIEKGFNNVARFEITNISNQYIALYKEML